MRKEETHIDRWPRARHVSSLVTLCCVAFAINTATAQTAELQRTVHEININSELRASPEAADDLALHDGMVLLFQEIIRFEGAPWIRLQFSDVILSGNVHKATGSKIRIMSLKDGAVQWLDAVSIRQWRNTSAYFNGDAVLVQLFAHPRTGLNRVAIDRVIVGEPPGESVPISICLGEDDREVSFAAPDARLWPVGCTAFLVNDDRGCLMTAGHCLASAGALDLNSNQVVEFNPPLSNPDGSINFAAPADQYAIDPDSVQFADPVCFQDWGYFGVMPNSQTFLMPIEAQGEAYDLADAAPEVADQTIRIRGYGSASPPLPPEWNHAQKTSDGPYMLLEDTRIGYQVDTSGGNSGSAVYMHEGDHVIGIHTCGGCGPTGGANTGTAIHHEPLQNALANPQSICLVTQQVEVPRDFATIQDAIDDVSFGSTITVAPGTYNEPINFHGKDLIIVSTDGPEATIIDASGIDGSAVRISGEQTPLSVLDGFTLTGGTGTDLGSDSPLLLGGGIYLSNSAPTIRNCIIEGNSAHYGGGMFNTVASPIVENTVFANNTATTVSGGGVYNLSNAAPQFVNVEFRGNVAAINGGAMVNHASNPTVIDSLFVDNEAAEHGGAVHNRLNSAGVFIGNSFENNLAGANGGAIFNDAAPDTELSQSIFCGNVPDDIAGAYTDTGGNDFLDVCPIPGDLTGTGFVNVDDLLIVLNNWGECDDCDDCLVDINEDCVVNVHDLVIVLDNWG